MTAFYVALIVAAISSAALGYPIIKVLRNLKAKQIISMDAPKQHQKKAGTPTMGGIIILAGFLIALLITSMIYPEMTLGAKYGNAHRAALALLTVLCSAIGFADDYLIVKRGKNLGLKARQKLAMQIVVAVAFVGYLASTSGAALTLVYIAPHHTIDLGWFYYPLAVLMIVGLSNAVNLADGLDGLCGGLTAIAAAALGALLMTINPIGDFRPWLMAFSGALAGSCIGFLLHNIHPAKVFMGDTGSLGLGAALGGLCIMMKQELIGLIICAVFVAEALSVMIQVGSFKLRGKRVFRMAPLHHHFELSGWKETKIVAVFWAWGIVFAFIALGLGVWSARS